VTKAAYAKAYDRACLEVSHIRKGFRSQALGRGRGLLGHAAAIEGILIAQGWSDGGITRKGLARMRKQLLRFDRFDAIELQGLNAARQSVITAGLAISEALFEVLEIEQMRTSPGALREGVLYDLMGRLRHEDVRERSISALMQRYNVDEETAQLVARRARMLFDAARRGWRWRMPTANSWNAPP
jgi:exopolyphosphatase/guanosine-5'-triphosphate,3'-diphosphate pyrophosphatase